ncbi:hypothetical protein L9F63_019407 [Diploptera punctata]|uniref:Uncharacterized protein n=1 Tax=Diploptera punctata TaxID=6984 RepID=A0AAD7ZUB1_DIPPU|nr:hypothetical protein L9F63_019407 [Diploptera punctata]
MDLTLLSVVILALTTATFALDSNQELARETTYISKRQHLPQNNTENKEYHSPFVRRIQQNLSSNKSNVLSTRKRQTNFEAQKKGVHSDDEKLNEEYLQSEEVDTMLMASAGRNRKNDKAKRGDDDDDDEDKKTLSQQIADGKYGLIEKEIYATTPKRPGIISYASNPEVPRDTAKNLGGLEPEEIWLAENHVLVIRGGYFPDHKFNRTDETATAWPPIDPYNAPPRQFIGFNGSSGPPPFPPFFPQPPPGNGSYFAPPFPFPPPPGNFTPGGGFYPPPGNGSYYPPPFPFPLPPPRNGSFFGPPGNFTPGSGPFYPPPFPGFPPNSTIRPPLFPPPLPPNGSLPFPPPFLQNLPPGAAFLPPPGNLTMPFDEDDPSIYYPPPYDFYYPQDNTTEVPPGPLVPGIILPPPPNFFAPLDSDKNKQTTQQPKPPTSHPSETDTLHRTYLPTTKTQVNTDRRPSVDQRKKPRPTVDSAYNYGNNQVTPTPEVNILTTQIPETPNFIEYTEKPPRPLINIAPQNVQVTHQGSTHVQPAPEQGYYYEEPAVVVTQAPDTIYINNVVKNDILTTSVPTISYHTAPVTDIVVKSTPKPQPSSESTPQTQQKHKIPQRQKTKPATTLSPIVIFYNPQQSQGIETNTVTPTPEPYYVKSQPVTATLPPIVYYTVPTTDKPNEPTSVKTSYYFYEEPHEGTIRNGDSTTTTQATPLNFDKPTIVYPAPQYTPPVSPTPNPTRGRTGSRKTRPQYVYSEKLPQGNGAKGYQELQSEPPPTQQSRPQISNVVTSTKVSAPPQQYVYSDTIPVEQAKRVRQRTRTQQYLLSSVLPLGQQVIYSNRPKIQYIQTTPAPQYYYVTGNPGLQYNVVGSSTPSIINQQAYVKPTPQPIVSNLAYFTTPRPNVAYQNIISSQSPIVYNIQTSSTPRPIYQYSFESNKNPSAQEPLVQNIYTTPRSRSRPSQKVNYQVNNQGPIVVPVQYQTTPRTLFEYSYEQQGLSTVAPQVQAYYSQAVPQYNQDVTAGSPTTHYGYEESREQNQQSYQSTPRSNYNRYQNPQVNIYPTANPLHAYFTRQDETLLDDITKKYFTIFGQKIQAGNEQGPTTPVPSYRRVNTQNRENQYYTTPSPKYNYQTAERPSQADNLGPIALADDINVNYKKPLPAVNPLSEYIDTRQTDSETGGALVSYKFPGDGGHFYFITPQVVGAQSQQPVNGYVYSLPEQQPELGIRYRRKKRKEQR